MVVLSHFSKAFEFLGLIGVEIFFALSGFLIGGILVRTNQKSESFNFQAVKTFWSRRWLRTLPNYCVFLALVSIQYKLQHQSWPEDLWKYLFFSQNLTSANLGFFALAWSLAIEEWFYLLFPLGIAVGRKFTGSWKIAIWWTVILFVAVSCAFRVVGIFATSDPFAERYVTLGRLDAIAYGVAVSVLDRENRWKEMLQNRCPPACCNSIMIAHSSLMKQLLQS